MLFSRSTHFLILSLIVSPTFGLAETCEDVSDSHFIEAAISYYLIEKQWAEIHYTEDDGTDATLRVQQYDDAVAFLEANKDCCKVVFPGGDGPLAPKEPAGHEKFDRFVELRVSIRFVEPVPLGTPDFSDSSRLRYYIPFDACANLLHELL